MATYERGKDQCPLCGGTKLTTSTICGPCNMEATRERNRQRALVSKGQRLRAPLPINETADHPHHWLIPSHGAEVWGQCKHCGEWKKFSNRMAETSWSDYQEAMTALREAW